MAGSIRLYTREECPLCSKAEALLAEAGIGDDCEVVDIDLDLALIRKYGDRVPVLENQATGEKLSWPFSASQVRSLIG